MSADLWDLHVNSKVWSIHGLAGGWIPATIDQRPCRVIPPWHFVEVGEAWHTTTTAGCLNATVVELNPNTGQKVINARSSQSIDANPNIHRSWPRRSNRRRDR